jgi:hypothetical protein
MTNVTQEIPRGDRWLVPVTVTIPDDDTFSWSGILAKCEVRNADDLSLFVTLTPTADLSVAGAATFTLELTGAQTITKDIGDKLVADLVIYRTSPTFGPHTLIVFQLSIVRRITTTT